jgi:lactobin A/cerein 7B family class IIb bacteriocin
MERQELTLNELKTIDGGEAITLSAVLAIMAVAIAAVVCYRLFVAGEGSVTLPGGYKFTWE